MLGVDVLDVLNDVAEDGLPQQFVLTAEQAEEQL